MEEGRERDDGGGRERDDGGCRKMETRNVMESKG